MSKEGESCSKTLWVGGSVRGGIEEGWQSSVGWGGDGKGPGVRPGLIPTFVTYPVYDFGLVPSPL